LAGSHVAVLLATLNSCLLTSSSIFRSIFCIIDRIDPLLFRQTVVVRDSRPQKGTKTLDLFRFTEDRIWVGNDAGRHEESRMGYACC
jgi:hypothetical protein